MSEVYESCEKIVEHIKGINKLSRFYRIHDKKQKRIVRQAECHYRESESPIDTRRASLQFTSVKTFMSAWHEKTITKENMKNASLS